MKILITAATEQEIEPLIKRNNETEVFITGAGIPSTVYQLTNKLLQQKYDLVIQAGIAGSFSKKIKKGEVVVVNQDAFADIGAEQNKNFVTIFQMGLAGENAFPFTNGWLVNSSQILQSSSLKIVKAITINKISDKRKWIKQLIDKYTADIESMEGAAFHFVCLQQKVPFLQIRSISNKAGDRNKTKWEIKKAIKNLNIELIKVVDLINKQ